MENKCPKCNKKLSVFYLKQNCPECGCDLLYYDMDNRLEQDHIKAEKEYAALDRALGRIKTVFQRILSVFKRKK